MPTVASIRRLGALSALLGALASAPPPAYAAARWLSPVALSSTLSGEQASRPALAIDGSGDAVAIWQHASGGEEVIEGALRPAGGPWQAPTPLTAPDSSGFNAQLAVGPGGEAIAVWEVPGGGKEVVEGSTLTPGGAWGAPVTLSGQGEEAQRPSVAIGAGGEAAAVWESELKSGEFTVVAATHSAQTGWQPPHTLSTAGTTTAMPVVGVDAAGEAIAVWSQSRETIVSAAHPAGGEWQPPVTLSSLGPAVSQPDLAVAPAGQAVAAWELVPSGKSSEATVRAAIRGADGEWAHPARVSEAGALDPVVAIDGAGDATAVWEQPGPPATIEAATHPAGAGWRNPEALSAPGEAVSEPAVAGDLGGDVLAAWRRSASGGQFELQAAARPAGGGWQPQVELSTPALAAGFPRVALDPFGDGAAAWEQAGPQAGDQIEVAGYDAAGPELEGLAIPTAGAIGQPLSFAVSPFDIWSALATTTWSFGDGATAVGTSAVHAFAAAGGYPVTVTSVDQLGNASSAAANVVIAATAQPPCACTSNPCPCVAAAPTVSDLRQSASRWREGPGLARISGAPGRRLPRAPLGTTFSFRLGAPSRVTLAFARARPGRTVAGHCRPPTAANARRSRCTRWVPAGSLSLSARAGTERVRFEGALTHRHRLPLGSYTITAKTPPQHGGISLRFTVVA